MLLSISSIEDDDSVIPALWFWISVSSSWVCVIVSFISLLAESTALVWWTVCLRTPSMFAIISVVALADSCDEEARFMPMFSSEFCALFKSIIIFCWRSRNVSMSLQSLPISSLRCILILYVKSASPLFSARPWIAFAALESGFVMKSINNTSAITMKSATQTIMTGMVEEKMPLLIVSIRIIG